MEADIKSKEMRGSFKNDHPERKSGKEVFLGNHSQQVYSEVIPWKTKRAVVAYDQDGNEIEGQVAVLVSIAEIKKSTGGYQILENLICD